MNQLPFDLEDEDDPPPKPKPPRAVPVRRPKPLSLDDDEPHRPREVRERPPGRQPPQGSYLPVLIGAVIVAVLGGMFLAGLSLKNRPLDDAIDDPPAAKNLTDSRPPAPKVTPPPPAHWSVAGEGPSVVDGVNVEIVCVQPSHQRDFIPVQIIWVATTQSATRNYNHGGWGSSSISLDDNFQNTYRSHGIVQFGIHQTGLPPRASSRLQEFQKAHPGVKTEYDSGPLNVDVARYGDIYFDQPIKTADRWYLTLSGKPLGLSGPFRFVIDPLKWASAKK